MNTDPIPMSVETFQKYGYMFLTFEHAAKDILATKDRTAYNEVIVTIQRMIEALHFDLLTADAPAPDKVQ